MKFAACALIEGPGNKYLALYSKKRGYTLPGGKCDDKDMLILHTCVREVYEETGAVVVELDDGMPPPFSMLADDFDTTTYRAKIVAMGKRIHSHEGDVVFATEEQLCNESMYSEYNVALFEYYR